MKECSINKLYQYIDNFNEILDFLSYKNFEMPSILSYRHMWFALMPGVEASVKTLEAIKKLVEIGDFVDCYVLIRKLRDNLLFDCVIAQDAESNHPVLNDNFMKQFLDDKGGLDPLILEETINAFVTVNTTYEEENEDKDRLDKWHNNEERYKDGERDKWIGYYEFKCKLETNTNILEINKKYLNKELFSLQKTTNSYVHMTSFNSSNNYLKPNKEHIELIYFLIKTIKIVLISYLMLIKSRIFAGTDYTDYLENGEEPPEGSQYWLAPIITDALSEIKEFNKDLYAYLKEHNTNRMLFE